MFYRNYMPAVRICLSVLLLSLVAGCAGYRLGNVGGREVQGIQSVYVPMVRNQTITAPGIEFQVTNAIINKFDTDGTLATKQSAQADSELEVVIIDYQRVPLRSTQQDALVTAEYRMIITARVTFTNRRTGNVVIRGERITGQTEFFVVQDLNEGQRQAIPLAAEDLADNIVNRIVEGW